MSKKYKNKDYKEFAANKARLLIVAKLEGFLGRNSDDYPGMKSIWKGWKVLYERIRVFKRILLFS